MADSGSEKPEKLATLKELIGPLAELVKTNVTFSVELKDWDVEEESV